jgi:spermidine/putrescine ABC transporter ATP-binding subunit
VDNLYSRPASPKGVSVSVRNVSRSFGDFKALDNVSIEIGKGEFFSLLGPSGCGKTTLLRIIAGFDSPDSGELLFGDKDVLSLPPDKRTSNLVFQTYALFPHLSVYGNIAFGLKLKHLKKSEIDEKVRHYVHMMELDEHIDKKPAQLSGGQKQRVAIARALINEPSVLLLDEPLSALDAKLRQSLLVELDEIHDQVGITFIYVTHDQSEALSVSDHIAVFNHGRVLQIGTPYEIYEAPATEFVARFIGETNLFPCRVLSSEKWKDEYMVTVDVPSLGTTVRVTDADDMKVGAELDFTIRPEKIKISLSDDASLENKFHGMVAEPVYSGFQSKFFIRLNGTGETIKVFKQHTTYLDDGPDIEWKDRVTIGWRAADGYLVKEKDI